MNIITDNAICSEISNSRRKCIVSSVLLWAQLSTSSTFPKLRPSSITMQHVAVRGGSTRGTETAATPYPVQRSELIRWKSRFLLPNTNGTARRHLVALRSTAHNQTKSEHRKFHNRESNEQRVNQILKRNQSRGADLKPRSVGFTGKNP